MHRTEGACGLVPWPRFGREKFGKFVGPAVEFLGVGRRLPLAGYVWPGFCVFRIQFKPERQFGFRVGFDRLGRALGLADSAVDAFVRMDVELIGKC